MSEVNRADDKPVKILIRKHQEKGLSGNRVVESRKTLKRISEKSYETLNWVPLSSLGVNDRRY